MTSAIDRVSLAAYASLAEVTEAGGATVLQTPAAPGSPMLNRVVGLGVDKAASEADVDAALGAVAADVVYYVAISPAARPAALGEWLAARGLEPGWGWTSFTRSVSQPPQADTRLRLARVESDDDAATFARIQLVSYGLPEALTQVLEQAPARGWECWLALDGDTAAGAGALFVQDGIAYLGFAATLPEHRGKGAQGALLAHRIRRAGELGCELVTTETGERRSDLPSGSFRNILRAGFAAGATTANWLGRA